VRPFIYGLVDPIEPRHIRYVGLAFSNPTRPYDHARLVRQGYCKNLYLKHWIELLWEKDRDYDVLVLEELHEGCSRPLLGFVEQCYIHSLRTFGHRLTNLARGGLGGAHSPEVYVQREANRTPTQLAAREAAMSAAWTAERKATHVTRHTGKIISKEHRAAVSNAWTPERREEQARRNRIQVQALVGTHWTEERRAQIQATWDAKRKRAEA
jgi:hypothetical protein